MDPLLHWCSGLDQQPPSHATILLLVTPLPGLVVPVQVQVLVQVQVRAAIPWCAPATA